MAIASTTSTAGTASRPLVSPPWWTQPRLIRGIFKDPQPVLDEVAARYGSMCGLGAGPLRLAIVGDPAALRAMWALPNDQFRWGHKFNVLKFVVGAESLIVSDGELHKRRRGAVQAAFSRRRLNRWIPMIVERTDAAIDQLVASLRGASAQQVDLYPVGRALVMEIAVRAFFGDGMAARVDEIGRLYEAPQRYLEGSFVRQLPHRIPHTERARVRADRAALARIVTEEIAQRRAHPTGDPFDLLEALATEGTLRDDEIVDQVLTLVGAGYDTTSASLAWMFWRATAAPGCWDALRAEADCVLGPRGAPAADETSLARLDFAGRVMRETTRLHPAAVLTPREAMADISLTGAVIPKGTMVLWSAYLAGRDPSVWDDPLRFDPDRFVTMTEEQRAVADQAWVPFGRGARNCIGFALAQMELTLIIARLAQRLDVAPTATALPRPRGMVVNRPTGGAPMLVTPRPD
jgi:cytochrome P450